MIDESHCKFVSSRGLLKSCNIHSDTPISSIRQVINSNFGKLGSVENPVIYICITALPNFINDIFPNITCKFILLTGDGDETCPIDVLKENTFMEFINSPKLIHWFSQNCVITNHPKLSQMPIGLDYHTMSQNDHEWGKKKSPLKQEKLLVNIAMSSPLLNERIPRAYSNFHFCMTTKYGYDRKDAFEKINKDLVYYEPVKVRRKESWEKQAEYAFVISPHGNGLDCHRTWEALCLGCIPIVKTSKLDPMYEGLPVLIVNDWADITQKLLDETIKSYSNIKFNYEKLTLKYWLDKINSYRK